VLSLHNEGKSLREIAREVSERFDADISHESVKNYINNHKDDKLARMTEENRGELAKREAELIIDYGDKLEKMDDMLETIMDETLNENDKNDVGQLLNVMKEVRSLMKWQKEYIEDVTKPNTEINNYEVNNTAIQISEKLLEMERDGIIEIKKPHKLDK